MNEFKSMVFFIIILLLLNPLLHGCTAMNYHMGKDLDESYPRKKIPVKDYKLLKKGDLVEIKLNDESRIRGQIVSLDIEQKIKIRDVGIDKDRMFGYETIEFEKIDSIFKLENGKEYRYIFGFIGLFGDTFIGLLIWLITHPIGPMMS